MQTEAAILDLRELGFDLTVGRDWRVSRADSGRMKRSLGVFLHHVSADLAINARALNLEGAKGDAGVEEFVASYLSVSWPGAAIEVSRSIHGRLNIVEAVIEAAMPGAIVREWVVSEGTRMANLAGYCDPLTWDDALDDARALAASVRFHRVVP